MILAARYTVFVIASLVIASWFVRVGAGEDRRMGVYTAVVSAAIALGVAAVIQHFYIHQRPFVVRDDAVLLLKHGADASFPSEHSTVAFAMATGIAWYRPRLGIVLLVLASITAFSRVYVGVHYPADVSGGALIGIFAATPVLGLRPVLAWIDRSFVLRVVPARFR
jgi:undecaprenyl-diphosphatase